MGPESRCLGRDVLTLKSYTSFMMDTAKTTGQFRPLATIAMMLGMIAVSSAIGQEQRLDDLFPSDRVIMVEIEVDEDDWDQIRFQTRSFMDALPPSRQFEPVDSPYSHVEANVTIDGVRHERVGLRKKGFIGSQDSERPSLKIKLDRYDEDGSMLGMKSLTFNNNKQDKSLLSQHLTYKLFDEAGSPGCRSGFARITVNGKDLGVYTHVESVKDHLLEREFGNSDGVLYEGTVTDFYPEWEGSFERKSGKRKKGLKHVKKLIEVLEEDELESLAELWKLVDEDAFYRFWALEGLLSFWDGYSGNRNNYFVYLNPDTGKFHFMPWGTDALFEKNPMGWEKDDSPKSVRTQGLITHRVFATDEGRKRYAREMRELLENHWDEEALLAEIIRVETLLDPHLDPSQIYSQDSGRLRRFIEKRRAEVAGEIAGDDMQPWDAPPAEPAIIGPGGFNDKPSESDLMAAAKNGDLEIIEMHLREGADINAVNKERGTALNIAAMAGQAESVALLLERGADPNLRNGDGGTPLISAAFLGHSEVVEILIEGGADVNARNNDQSTAMMAAAVPWTPEIKGLVEFLSMYFQLGLDLKEVRENRPDTVKLLAQAGGTGSAPETSEEIGELREIIKSGRDADLAKAIKDCPDLDARDQMGITPLCWAALADNPKAVRELLAAGVDINATNQDGGTALIGAAFLGRVDIVKLLLESNVDTSIRNRDGASAEDSASAPWGPEIEGIAVWLRDNLQIKIDLAAMRTQRPECADLIRKAYH
jgi:ankyrin repeat protein